VLSLRAEREGGAVVEFKARIRIDSPAELETFRHGGILHAVVRQLLRPDFGRP
jgi:aconitate hydratase